MDYRSVLMIATKQFEKMGQNIGNSKKINIGIGISVKCHICWVLNTATSNTAGLHQ
jgi:hypothetical protein